MDQRIRAEGSHFEGSGDEGPTIRFLIFEGSGMVSMIARNRPPAYENYTLSDAGTDLKIDVDTALEFETYMEDAWPKALAKLKALCEAAA